MEAVGLGQSELGRRVGISQASVWALINRNKIGSRYIDRIARELRTTTAYLEGATDDPTAEYPDDLLTAEERDWLAWLRAATPGDRRALLHLAERLVAPSGSSTLHAKRDTYRGDDGRGIGGTAEEA